MIQPTIPVTAPMSPDLEYRTRIAAARQRISRAEFIRQAVVQYLETIELETDDQETDREHE